MSKRFLLAALLVVASVAAAAPAGDAQSPTPTRPKPTRVFIPPEPLPFKPGASLSTRALVARPPAVKGLVAWTLESRRHRGPFYAMALSPDGRLLATGGFDGTVRVWETETGKFLRALVGHTYYVHSLAFSPDGHTLASAGGYDGTTRLWDVQTGQTLRILRENKGYVSHVAWAPDGKTLIAAGGTSGFIFHWDIRGRVLKKVELGRPIGSVSWAPDGRTVAVAGSQLAIQLWDLDLGKVTGTLGQVTDEFAVAAWSPDGRTIATGGLKQTRLWEAKAEGKALYTFDHSANTVAWSPDGKRLAAGSYREAKVRFFDVASGKPLEPLPDYVYAYSLLWSQDGKSLLTGDYSQVRFWDPVALREQRGYALAATTPVRWEPGRPLLTGVGEATLHLWDQATGKPLRSLAGHTGVVTAVAWSPDGKVLASGGNDTTVRLWETATGKLLLTLKGHTGTVTVLDWANDGKTLASGSSDRTVRLWNPGSEKSVRTLQGHKEGVTVLAWSPGGRLLASAGGETVRLDNPQTGQMQGTIKNTSTTMSLAWSSDGRTLAAGTYNHSIGLYRSSGKLLQTLESSTNPPPVNALAWSPKGPILAAGRRGHAVQLWHGRSAKLLQSLETWAEIQWVGWTPGGSTVAAGCADRTVRFFDAASKRVRGYLIAEEKQVVAISPDGHYRGGPGLESEWFYVAQLDKGQQTIPLAEFTAKYRWKNVPGAVKLTGN